MQVIVEITSGPSSGEKIRLEPGQTVSVGRTSRADFAFPQDTYLSGVHFALEREGDACRLRDLNSSNGTSVNGERVTEASLREGDEIAAGHMTFKVHIETSADASLLPDAPALAVVVDEETIRTASLSSKAAPESLTPYASRLLEILRAQPEPLFALLDAARDARVLQLLRDSKEKYQSLYEGEQGKLLDDYAPYLVSLLPESSFLETLAQEGWGKSWGLYLTSQRPFAKVRRHLRQFLMVKDEDGRELYFRFYDPRVMRIYLPTCNAAESTHIFGPISRYLAEDLKPDALLQFTDGGQGAAQQKILLSA